MRSLVLFCAFAFLTLTAHAQPRRKAAPPPPPPPPPAAPATTIGTFPVGAPPPPEVNTSGQPMADSPLLQRETEIRRGMHFEAFLDAQATFGK